MENKSTNGIRLFDFVLAWSTLFFFFPSQGVQLGQRVFYRRLLLPYSVIYHFTFVDYTSHD